jgi:hypothetical protein
MEVQLNEIDIQKKRAELQKLLEFGIHDKANETIEGEIVILQDNDKKNKVYKELKYLDNPATYSVIKKAIKEQWAKDGSLRFFINNNKHIKGKITNKIEEGIIDIPLIEKYTKEHISRFGVQTEVGLTIFGDKRIKDSMIANYLTHKFHIYRIVVKENEAIQNYTLLSEKPLDIGEYDIYGMVLELEDYSELSKYTRLMKKNHIIFVNQAIPSKITFSSNEHFMEFISKYNLTEDKFFKEFLTLGEEGNSFYFGHPRYFERLSASFFLSSKQDTSPYPLHWLIIGKQGGGKSKIMESMAEKMDETLPIVEGSGSTMKSLIPSFKGDLTKAGALIESNRMVFVDEFFRILMRVDKDDRENTLTHLNPLLEHKKRRFASGNNFLDAQMTSKMLAVTNPVFGTSTMESLVKKMDNSFLSRIFIWYQDEEHFNKVINTREDQLEPVTKEMTNEDWKAVFDFCNSFKSKINILRCNELHKEGLGNLGILSEEIREIYKSRYKHHLSCLLDGLVKLRCILEKDTTFEAKDADYDSCKQIWFKMIENWKNGLENVRFQLREDRFY